MRRAVLDLKDVRPIWAMPEWSTERIRAAFPDDWEVLVLAGEADGQGDGGGPREEAIAAVRGAEVYLGYGFPKPLFDAGHPTLRWVHSGAAGVGSALYPEMRDSRILLTNSAGIHAEPMAETVLAMVLHFARGLDLAIRSQAARSWGKAPFEAAESPVREIGGATMGILGLGGIGRAIARRALALDMQVLAWKRTAGDAPEGVELCLGDEGFRSILERSDYLVLTVPETGETRGLVGAEALGRMRAGAVLVNVARGRVVDEEALIEALRGGRLRGAGLDVFREEPLPRDSPLWEMENVLITPHASATSRGFWPRQTELIVDNVGRYLRGAPLRNLVDKGAGY